MLKGVRLVLKFLMRRSGSKTVPQDLPKSTCADLTIDSYIDRWNSTVREELLDRRIIFGERDLRRLLRAALTISIIFVRCQIQLQLLT